MKVRLLLLQAVGAAGVLASSVAFSGSEVEPKVEPRAKEALQKMIDYFLSADSFSFTALTSTEDVSSTLQKIQENSSMEGTIQRPNKVYLKKSGADQTTLWWDGETVTLLDRKSNKYAKLALAGDVHDLVKKLDALGIETPFSGLIDSKLMQHVEDHVFKGDFYGASEIAGVTVNHLAFRQDAVDWQLWTDAASGAPKKLVITSKMLAAAPQHVVLIQKEVVNPSDIQASVFQAQIPVDATEVPVHSDDAEVLRNAEW